MEPSRPDPTFRLPLAFEYGATALWVFSGALVAARRRCDIAGLTLIALVSATGGGILRDGIFINDGPPALLRSPAAVSIAVVVALAVWAVGHQVDRIPRLATTVLLIDAVGLGAFGLIGLQIALAGCLIFLAVVAGAGVGGGAAGVVAVAAIFLIRTAALRFGLRPHPARGFGTERIGDRRDGRRRPLSPILYVLSPIRSERSRPWESARSRWRCGACRGGKGSAGRSSPSRESPSWRSGSSWCFGRTTWET